MMQLHSHSDHTTKTQVFWSKSSSKCTCTQIHENMHRHTPLRGLPATSKLSELCTVRRNFEVNQFLYLDLYRT